MNENSYESLLRVRRGLAWMLGSYVMMVLVVILFDMIVTSIIRRDTPTELLLRRFAFYFLAAGVLAFLGMQFRAALCCWRCPVDVVRRGKWWIFASAAFYGVFLPAAYITMRRSESLRFGESDFLADVLWWIAIWCFGISGWFWQYFLLELARGLKSGWNATAGKLVILLFSVAGFCTMFVFGDESRSGFVFEWMMLYSQYVILTAMITGFGFMGLYACMLVGLWWRIGKLCGRG